MQEGVMSHGEYKTTHVSMRYATGKKESCHMLEGVTPRAGKVRVQGKSVTTHVELRHAKCRNTSCHM